MDWMDFHLFVASCVYTMGIVFGIVCISCTLAWIGESYNRAKIKRKARKILRNILVKFIKTES